MADRFAAGMDDDEVVAALNALAVEIQQKQDNIDNLGGEVTTLRAEKATLAGEVATIRTEKATLETTVATLRREKDVLAADLVTLERNHVILQADHILLQRATNTLTAGYASTIVTDPTHFKRSACDREAPFNPATKTGHLLIEQAQSALPISFDGKPLSLQPFLNAISADVTACHLQEAITIVNSDVLVMCL